MTVSSAPSESSANSGSPSFDEDAFVALSAELTGFSVTELLSTAQAPAYIACIGDRFPAPLDALLARWRDAVATAPPGEREALMRAEILADDVIGPLARSVALLWYTASWYPPPHHWSARQGVPGDAQVAVKGAFPESLMWKAAGAHPTAAKPTGFGSWSLPPADR